MVADFLKDPASFCSPCHARDWQRVVLLLLLRPSLSCDVSYIVSMETSDPSPLVARRLVLRLHFDVFPTSSLTSASS